MKITDGISFDENIKTAVTIGKFDGVHIGHQKLLKETYSFKEKRLVPVALTFDINFEYILDRSDSRNMFEKMGIEILVEYPFDDKTKNMNPEEFFEYIIVGKLHAGAVVVGNDFRFGHNRSGDIDTLKKLGEKYGVVIDIVEKEKLDGEVVSSTRIRNELSNGNIQLVNRLLGREYSVTGEVIYGNQLGRTLNMPTINLGFDCKRIVPPRGVYASLVNYDGKIYGGVTNVGFKPTAPGISNLGVETFIFDFDKMIYGETVTVKLLDYQRKERKFESLDELKEQMVIDVHKAKETVKKYEQNILQSEV